MRVFSLALGNSGDNLLGLVWLIVLESDSTGEVLLLDRYRPQEDVVALMYATMPPSRGNTTGRLAHIVPKFTSATLDNCKKRG